MQQSPVRDKEVNLSKAIQSYKDALLERTRERFPLDWAKTQNNLGLAYTNLASVRDKEVNLSKAIQSCKDALLELTHERFPLDWAMTQNNLGNAYGDLALVRDKEVNLSKAIQSYKDALHVYQESVFPFDFAMTQNNLGITLNDQGNLEAARDAFLAGARAYRANGLEEQAQPLEEDARRLDLFLDARRLAELVGLNRKEPSPGRDRGGGGDDGARTDEAESLPPTGSDAAAEAPDALWNRLAGRPKRRSRDPRS